MEAEPFEGDHWGAGYDDEVREGWTDSDNEGDESPQEDNIITPSSKTGRNAGTRLITETSGRGEMERLREATTRLRLAKEDMYWKQEVIDVREEPSGRFGWKDLSTGP
jgi:gamma-tubulin complex component 5